MQLSNRLLNQLGTFDNGDVDPTAAMLAAYRSACNDLGKSIGAWRAINGADLTALNAALSAARRTRWRRLWECSRRLVVHRLRRRWEQSPRPLFNESFIIFGVR